MDIKKTIDKKLIANCITIAIFGALILIFELFFCNSKYITGMQETYNFSLYRIIWYIAVICLFVIFFKKIMDIVGENLEKKRLYSIVVITMFMVILVCILATIEREIDAKLAMLLITILMVLSFVLLLTNDYKKNVVILIMIFRYNSYTCNTD